MEASNQHGEIHHDPLASQGNSTFSNDEKLKNIDDKPLDSLDPLDPLEHLEQDLEPAYHNGEPVITTGRDVSRFVVDIRDDEDPALTFRSIFLGTIFAAMGATLGQVQKQFITMTCYCQGSNFHQFVLTISGRYSYSSQCRPQSPQSSCCS